MSSAGTAADTSSEWTVRSPSITAKGSLGAEAVLLSVLAAAAFVFWLRGREATRRRAPGRAARSRGPRR